MTGTLPWRTKATAVPRTRPKAIANTPMDSVTGRALNSFGKTEIKYCQSNMAYFFVISISKYFKEMASIVPSSYIP